MVRKYLCPAATDPEIGLFLEVCKSHQLDPFKREAHLIKYAASQPATIVVGYEVYLKRAQIHPDYGGFKVWVEKDDKGKLLYGRIEIYRKSDPEHPFEWEVPFGEVYRENRIWKTQPEFQLKKCAIGQGHRLFASVVLGGMPYLPEELPTDMVGEASSSDELPKGEVDAMDAECENYEEPPPASGQDVIDEITGEGNEYDEPPTSEALASRQSGIAPEPPPEVEEELDVEAVQQTLTEKEGKWVYATARNAGYSLDDIMKVLKQLFKVTHTTHLPKRKLMRVIKAFKNKEFTIDDEGNAIFTGQKE